VRGETTVEGSGEFAQLLRRFVTQSEGKSAQVALDALGKQLNIIGEYGLEMPPATTTSRSSCWPKGRRRAACAGTNGRSQLEFTREWSRHEQTIVER
jgi:hypothetical protein